MTSRRWPLVAVLLCGVLTPIPTLAPVAAPPTSPARLPDAVPVALEPPSGEQDYRLPSDAVVLRLFRRPEHEWSAGHRGVDVAGGDGVVRAPGPGVVTFSGWVVDRGVVTITHPDGLRSSLEPVADPPAAGTVVVTGDAVGTVAPGHCAPDPCVHWGVRRGQDYLDPLSLLGPEPVVLLPVP
jgi:murein DD-endopeptidase MepM/ murein hydrolase activator NlpD